MPISARRRARRAANSRWEMRGPGQSSACEVFSAMVAKRFFTNAAFKIVAIQVRVKIIESFCLTEHLRGRARGILAEAVGDQILDRKDREGSIGKFDQRDARALSTPPPIGAEATTSKPSFRSG